MASMITTPLVRKYGNPQIQKKTMKKIFLSLGTFALFLMGALTIGCTEISEEIIPDGPVTLSTSVSFSDATKALSEAGVKTFAAGDRIAVIYKNTSGQTKKAISEALVGNGTDIQNGGKYAEFTVTLSSPKANGKVRYIYPAGMAKETIATDAETDNEDATVNYDALSTQDGTIEYIRSEERV